MPPERFQVSASTTGDTFALYGFFVGDVAFELKFFFLLLKLFELLIKSRLVLI